MRDRPAYRFLYLIYALGVLHLLGLMALEAYRAYTDRQEAERVEAENAELAARISLLEEELAHADDPAYREALARRLGYVRKDEVLYARPDH